MSKNRISDSDHDFQGQLDLIGQDLKDLVKHVRGAGREGVGKARNTVVGAYEESRDKVRSATDSLEQRVAAKPLQSLAVAATAGCVLSWLLRRR